VNLSSLAARYLEKKTRRFRVESAIFLFTRRVLAFFRVNPAKSFNQPNLFNPGRLFYQSSGHPRVNLGKQERGGVKKIKKIGEFYFRGILQPTTG